MASTSLLCGICSFRNIFKESVIWCSECNEGLCVDCVEHHNVSKASRHHITTPIADYRELPVEILEISQCCNEHSENYQIFCKKHNTPCCQKCVIENHNDCIDLVVIQDVTENVKSSNALLEMEKILVKLDKKIDLISKDTENNLLSFRKDKQKIEKNVKQTRALINSYLDRIEKDLFTELEISEEKERKKISTLLMSLEKKKNEIKSLQKNIDKLKRHASDLQTFLAMRLIQSEIARKERSIESISRSDEVRHITISCDIDDNLLKISTKVKKFGNVHVETETNKLDLVRFKEKESIDHLKVQLEKTIDTKLTYLNGCHMLPDGRMIFSAYLLGEIVVLSSDGSIEFEINPYHFPFDITSLKEDGIIAASSWAGNQISIIDLKNKRIEKTYKEEPKIGGISFRENTILYCAEEKGIQQLNLNNESISSIMKCEVSENSYIATFGDDIYFTNYRNNTVTCCDFKGKTKWIFKDESVLRSPLGITVDNYGNVFVVGYASNSVVVISNDGKHHKQILSAKDGLYGPSVLYFDRRSKNLLVTNYHYKIFLFTLT